jgi:ABC transporter substrate binding protein
VPKVASFAFLTPSLYPGAESQLRDVQAAADAMGQKLFVFDARSDNDIHSAYAAMTEKRVSALLLASAPFLVERMNTIVPLAIRHAIPTCYFERQFVVAGGLMSYGARRSDAYRQAGIYAGRILRGEKPNLVEMFRLSQANITQILQCLGRAVGQILVAAHRKHRHLSNHQVRPVSIRGVDHFAATMSCRQLRVGRRPTCSASFTISNRARVKVRTATP